MRRHRLLNERGQQGSAPVEFVFVALFVTFVFLAVVEVAFALYGRNVIAASAHEAARKAIELGSESSDARAIATDTVARSAGALIDGYEVDVRSGRVGERVVVRVRVAGRIDPPGPLPITVPIDLTATAARGVTP